MNKVYQDFGLNISQIPVEVSNMNWRILHKSVDIIFCHRDDYLLPGRTFSCYLDVRLGLKRSFNDVVDLVDLFGTNEWKCFFNLDYIYRAHILFGCLSIRLGFVSCWIDWFATLEELRNFVDLFRSFGGDGRGKPFDISWEWTILFLASLLGSWLHLGGEFWHNFPP